MAKALKSRAHGSRPASAALGRGKGHRLSDQLSPGELRVYIHFLRGSLKENPGGKSVLQALEAARARLR